MAVQQAPPSLGFSRQEHWSGLPFPSPMHESEKWNRSCSVMSDSSQPHGLQPTRLPRPWDFLGKSTAVRCHRLLRSNRKFEVADAWYFTRFISRSYIHLWGGISNISYLCKLYPISKMPSLAMKSGISSQIGHFLFSYLVYRGASSQAFQSCRYFTHACVSQ